MNTRLLATFLLSACLLAAACGGSTGPGESAPRPPAAATEPSPQTSEQSRPEASTTATDVAAGRFVFGATPGKPVVYWIHTDW
jgi:hypothetical protein